MVVGASGGSLVEAQDGVDLDAGDNGDSVERDRRDEIDGEPTAEVVLGDEVVGEHERALLVEAREEGEDDC